ncbi:hypothetical protein [Clostridium botulinum]|uniref:hypothetical protein n=1 Tax=Clostridium botulinum TaxID=1491 RepID=UPI0013F08AD6|nr:hypothetical protein [Clostridium botulinum]MBY6809004.1 hypothetical protein [Clostridium botulinum]MBY6822291.1 hypothetical protein [Clostridium botulinum]MBY6832919.1 hypothetical protein [Clostridium botulinum]MBY6972147.1 hypothetical protein [Clostridium botulinum]MCS6107947.1 hypothetical protein [Clostridium botulinum]
MKFVETFIYNECEFRIYEEKGIYYGKCEEMSTHGETIQSLKNTDIPNCYHSNRVFKLGR